MGTRNERLTPFTAVPPGLIVKNEMAERKISQKSFAGMLNMQASHLSDILNGKRSINSIADKIEEILGIPARTLVKMQASYDYDKKVLEMRGVQEIKAKNELDDYNKSFDVKTAVYRLGIDRSKGSVHVLSSLKKDLLLPCAAQMEMNYSHSFFRKSDNTGTDDRMIATWVLLARYEARKMAVSGKYDKSKTEELSKKLVTIFNENKNVITRVQSVMSDYGIKFCVVPKVDKASINGYCFLENNIPSIVLTLRYNMIDHAAFDTMHELGHVLLHLRDNNDEMISIDGQDYSSKEKEADEFASSSIIPDSLWKTSPAVRMNPFIIQRDYSKWAERQGIHKWIVLGRISHETGIRKFKGDDTRKIG